MIIIAIMVISITVGDNNNDIIVRTTALMINNQ